MSALLVCFIKLAQCAKFGTPSLERPIWIFKRKQQDSALHNSIYYYNYYNCFLPLVVRSSRSSTNTRCCVYSFELLMMGGGTAWNMWSNYSNKYHCVTLHLVGLLEYINDARSHERKKRNQYESLINRTACRKIKVLLPYRFTFMIETGRHCTSSFHRISCHQSMAVISMKSTSEKVSSFYMTTKRS